MVITITLLFTSTFKLIIIFHNFNFSSLVKNYINKVDKLIAAFLLTFLYKIIEVGMFVQKSFDILLSVELL